MAEAYCKTDKKMVEVLNPQRITLKNGKPALQGACPECGGKVVREGVNPFVLATSRAAVCSGSALTRRRGGLENGNAHRRSGDLFLPHGPCLKLVDGHAFQRFRT